MRLRHFLLPLSALVFAIGVSPALAQQTTTLYDVSSDALVRGPAPLRSWSVITRGSGFDTFSATPSSANLRGLVTDETGTSGGLVFAGSPTLITPVLGAATGTSLSLSGGASAQSYTITGNISAPAWTTSGVRIKGVAATLTDTSSSGTVATAYTDAFGGNTIAASNATTFTNYYTAFFSAPVAGTNVNITNGWGLGAASLRIGTSGFFTVSATGNVALASTTASTSTTTGSLTTAGGLSAQGAAFIGTTLNVKGAASATNDFRVGVLSDSTTFNAFSFNSLMASGTLIGIAGGGDASMYYNVATGGSHILRVAGAAALSISSTTSAVASTTEATTGGAGSLTTAGGIYAAKAIISNSSTASTSASTGSFITAGGAGIGLGLNVGGNAKVAGLASIGGANNVNAGLPTAWTGNYGIGFNYSGGTNSIYFGDGSGSYFAKFVTRTGSADTVHLSIEDTGKVLAINPAGGLGYGTGAGGAVTQLTSRTTGVTLNKVSGAITLFTAAGSATATSFTVTNSTVSATDTIVLSVKSGTNKYLAFVTAVAAGSFEITFYTTGGTASDAPVINYAIVKAVAS